ncbi:TonB-dependent receptor [Rufibacter immobilis]|uniref:TonB-dependent receptor n=1 Tax=Rufibacter immobilis TaxID=1348778 RepID=UPI001FE7173C|nr:TonB-dependent receptor [Rufibacter immobilis]
MAQRSGSVTLQVNNSSIEEFVQQIESKTPFRFFYDPHQLADIRITLQINEQPIASVLEQAFKGTNIQFAIDPQQNVFLVRGKEIATTLPPDLFPAPAGLVDKAKSVARQQLPLEPGKTAFIAAQENKVYVIGVKGLNQEARATISGFVKEAGTVKPLIGATIFHQTTGAGTATDGNGYFTLTLPKGPQALTIRSLGMKDAKRQVILFSNGSLDIALFPANTALKEVLVQAEEESNIKKLQMGMEKLDVSTIKQVPTVFGEADVLRVILTLPGVKSVGEATTGFNVRGGATDQNLILFNDATLYNPSHFFGFFSAFNPEIIKDVELYKSSIPAKYGGRVSSVLNINSREGNKVKIAGSAGIGLLTSRLNLEGPLMKDKSSFLFGTRTTYSNWLLKLLPNDSGYKGSKASFYDVNLHLNHQFNENNRLAVTSYWSKDASNLNTDTLFSYSNRNLSLKWSHAFSSKFFGNFTVGQDHYHYENYSQANPITAYKLAFSLNQANLKADFTYELHPKHTLSLGAGAVYYNLKPGTYRPMGTESLVLPVEIEQEKALESALYIEDNFAVNHRLSFSLGLRFSVFNYLGAQSIDTYAAKLPKDEFSKTGTKTFGENEVVQTYSNPEVRMSGRYAFTENFSVKAGYNTLRQNIHMLSNTTAIAPTDIWKLSDPNIKPQLSQQLSLGLYQNLFSNQLELSAETYYKKLKNYLDYKSGAVLVMNPHIETDVVSTHGKAYGVELMVKKAAGNFNGWVSYTYSRIFLQMNDATQGPLINKGEFYPAAYDKPHDVTFVGNQKISRRFSVSLNMTYSTGRPVTIPIGRFTYGGSQKTLYSGRNDYRIPDYFRTDLSLNIEGNHKLKQLTHNSWTLGVYNITGRKNPYSVYFTSDKGVVKGYKLSVFGAAIPFVNFNIRF